MRKVLLAGGIGVLSLALTGAPAPAAGGPTVTADNFSFAPKTVAINAGQRVSWKDTEGSHTVTFRHSKFDKTIGPGDTVSRKFKKPGTYRYVCSFHIAEKMKGKVVVK